jgi:hypothetical protein
MELFNDLDFKTFYDFNDAEKYNLLRSKLAYRLDTNFAKMDRIQNSIIEKFKNETLNYKVDGTRLGDWRKKIHIN